MSPVEIVLIDTSKLPEEFIVIPAGTKKDTDKFLKDKSYTIERFAHSGGDNLIDSLYNKPIPLPAIIGVTDETHLREYMTEEAYQGALADRRQNHKQYKAISKHRKKSK